MKLIKLNTNEKPKFKSEIPEDIKNKIYTMFNKLDVVNYPSSNHEIINAKINGEKWEILYPANMYVKCNEVNEHTLKITGVRLSTENEIILGAFNHTVHCHFKVVL